MLIDALEQFKEIGFYTVALVLLLLFIAVPTIVETAKKWKALGGKSQRQLKDEKIDTEIHRLDKKVDDIEACLNTRIDGLFAKQDVYHQESITIRSSLEKNQDKLFDTISSFTSILSEIKTDLTEERIERKRWNILNFADELRHSENNPDRERFDNVFRDYDDYERIIHEKGLKNGFVEESIKFIKLKYQEMLNED